MASKAKVLICCIVLWFGFCDCFSTVRFLVGCIIRTIDITLGSRQSEPNICVRVCDESFGNLVCGALLRIATREHFFSVVSQRITPTRPVLEIRCHPSIWPVLEIGPTCIKSSNWIRPNHPIVLCLADTNHIRVYPVPTIAFCACRNIFRFCASTIHAHRLITEFHPANETVLIRRHCKIGDEVQLCWNSSSYNYPRCGRQMNICCGHDIGRTTFLQAWCGVNKQWGAGRNAPIILIHYVHV